MFKGIPASQLFTQLPDFILPSVTINNVIFGFHENEMRVLLLQFKNSDAWILPGGYVYKDEDLDEAATRILQFRTGLPDLFLQQFEVFGRAKRTDEAQLRRRLEATGVNVPDKSWVLERSISVGYYALVDYAKTKPVADEFSVYCGWFELAKSPPLAFDHQIILDSALKALRMHLNYKPIGYNLLPGEFTLKNLQTVYETILSRKLDRSNFSRKILSYNILDRKEKYYSGAANKAPYLYSFNKEAYFNALQHGFDKDF